eukprot:3091326-Rhodomonas_salina.1
MSGTDQGHDATRTSGKPGSYGRHAPCCFCATCSTELGLLRTARYWPTRAATRCPEWKAANETARAEAEGHVTAIVLRRPYAQPGTEIAYAGVTGRGDFAWVERSPDGTEAGAVSTDPVADGTLSGSNASNLTGVWVWCKNASDIAK